eukprot:gene16848-18547_t
MAAAWQARISESEVIFNQNQDVSRHGMMDLLSACNTIVQPKLCDNSPYADHATVTIYGKPTNGVSLSSLKEIVHGVNNFKNIVGFLAEGHPQLFRVKFPYLQKYKNELQHCLMMVVEIPYEFDMLAQVTQNSNLCIKQFENVRTFAYADLGEIELSKMKCIFADCYSGGDVVCRDHYNGSGTFKTMLKGGVYFKKMQGTNFSIYSEHGDLVTDAVYCEDMVYCAEQGDVIAGTVQSNECYFETYNGQINIGSLSTNKTIGRITESGNLDVALEKSTEFEYENEKLGDITLRLNPSVEANLLINSKSSSVSSELNFDELEKNNDPIGKYEVLKGKIGHNRKDINLNAHKGHVTVTVGDWMSSLKRFLVK